MHSVLEDLMSELEAPCDFHHGWSGRVQADSLRWSSLW